MSDIGGKIHSLCVAGIRLAENVGIAGLPPLVLGWPSGLVIRFMVNVNHQKRRSRECHSSHHY